MTSDGRDGHKNDPAIDPLIQPHDSAAEVAKWKHIKVLAQELEKELREVQSYYWISQMIKLHDRAVFEARKSQGMGTDGDIPRWWTSRDSRVE